MSVTNFLYNPERKGKEKLIDEFVIRQDILELIMEDLKTSTMQTPEQHYLLVGQRGTGKTTLLHRIRYAVEDDSTLKNLLIPIVLTEEQYNISELANLWETVGQLLEDYYGFEGLFNKMEKNLPASNYDELCWETLEGALNEHGKSLLLFVDNVGDLLKKLDENQVRRLRRILQTKPQIRLIAASSLYLESIFDYKEPLFEFFKILRLEDLNNEETRILLLKLAQINNEEHKIERIIQETPERIETLRTLTGGVPRTIALMFNIFVEYEYETSFKDLERILDLVTPLYKHRMDDLPAQQQKIIDAVAKAWDPIGVKALRDKVRLESKVISAQLRQLEKNQVAQKLETNTKNHEYILRERFFNIWYLMRYGRKEDRQRVIWLVRFLESWCTDEEIETRIEGFVNQMRAKELGEDNLDFMWEVYTSIRNLTLPAKLLLRRKIPSKYLNNLQFNDMEVNEAAAQYFKKEDYSEAMEWTTRVDLLEDENKFRILELMKRAFEKDIKNLVLIGEAKLLRIQRLKERIEELKGQIERYDPNARSPQGIEELKLELHHLNMQNRISMAESVIFAYVGVLAALKYDEYDSAITMVNSCMFIIYTVSKFYDQIIGVKGEMKFLLLAIRELYLKGQIHSVSKLFSGGVIEEGNAKIPYSEIFNPIYLAINSLDPEAEKVNLAPEKAGIVEEIREFIQKEG